MLNILVIVGSVREGRIADKVFDLANNQLTLGEAIIDVADLKEVNLPFYNESLSPIYAKGQYKSAVGTEWAQRVKDADKILILSPEYNYSVPAVLKNAVDWAYEGWINKPVAIITWGVNSGLDAYAHLQDIFEKLPSNLVGGGHIMLAGIGDDNKAALSQISHAIGLLEEA